MKGSEKMFKLPAISLALFVIYLTICKVAIKNKKKKKPLRKRNGFEREVLVNPVLAHTGKVGILLFQLLCQGESLRAIDSARSHVKMLDIGF